MPSSSDKQRKFFGAELARKKAGEKTKTDMPEKKLRTFASKDIKKVMGPVGGLGMQPTPKGGGSPVSGSKTILTNPRSVAAKHKTSIDKLIKQATTPMTTGEGAPKVPKAKGSTQFKIPGGGRKGGSPLTRTRAGAAAQGGVASTQSQEKVPSDAVYSPQATRTGPRGGKYFVPGDEGYNEAAAKKKDEGAATTTADPKVDSENRLIEDQRPDLNYMPEPQRPSMGEMMTEEQKQLQAADRGAFFENAKAAMKEVDPNPEHHARAGHMDPREIGGVYEKMSDKEKAAVDKYLPPKEYYKKQQEYGNKKAEVDKKNQEIKDLKHPKQDEKHGDVRGIHNFDPLRMARRGGESGNIGGVHYSADEIKQMNDMSEEERVRQHLDKKGDYEGKENDLKRIDELLNKDKEGEKPAAEEGKRTEQLYDGSGANTQQTTEQTGESQTGLENIQDPEVQQLNTELNTARNTAQGYDRANRELDRRRTQSTDPGERKLIEQIQDYNNGKKEEQKGIIQRIADALMAALKRFMEEMNMSDPMPMGTPPFMDPDDIGRGAQQQQQADSEPEMPKTRPTVDPRTQGIEAQPKGPQRRRTAEEQKAFEAELRRRNALLNAMYKSLKKMDKDYPFLMLSKQKDYITTANMIQKWMYKAPAQTVKKD